MVPFLRMVKYVIKITDIFFYLINFIAFQTGSGKTFAITGSPENYEDRGIIPRSIQHIFDYTVNVRIFTVFYNHITLNNLTFN